MKTVAAGGAPRRRWRRRGVVLLVLLASSLVAGLALELAGRGFLRLRGQPWSAEEARASLEHLREGILRLDWRQAAIGDGGADRAGHILHPYIGFDTLATQRLYPRTAFEMRTPPAAENFHVVVVGGSVSCLMVLHAEDRLIQRLQQDPRWQGRPMQVHILGQGGMKQPQQLMAVSYALAMGWQPDLVINIDGFNEVALGYHNTDFGAHPLHPSVSHWSHLLRGRSPSPEAAERQREMLAIRERMKRILDFSLDGRALGSAVVGSLCWRAVQGELQRYRELQGEYVEVLTSTPDPSLHGPPLRPGKDAALREAVRGWLESSVSLSAICEARGIPYLHVLQPTLHDEGSKPLTAEEVASGGAPRHWREGARDGYPLLRLAGQELAERGVHFFDASMLFVDVEETLYYDSCHVTVAGSAMLVDAIAAELRQQRP